MRHVIFWLMFSHYPSVSCSRVLLHSCLLFLFFHVVCVFTMIQTPTELAKQPLTVLMLDINYQRS